MAPKFTPSLFTHREWGGKDVLCEIEVVHIRNHFTTDRESRVFEFSDEVRSNRWVYSYFPGLALEHSPNSGYDEVFRRKLFAMTPAGTDPERSDEFCERIVDYARRISKGRGGVAVTASVEIEETVFYPPAISVLKKERFGGEEEKGRVLCSICFEEFRSGVIVSPLPCSHRFHFDCVSRWVMENERCPLCRVDIWGQTQRINGEGSSSSSPSSSSLRIDGAGEQV